MKKILIADDSFVARTSLSNMLQNDYEIDIATTGKEAVEKVENNQIDCVMLDLLMPEMTGQEALSIIKKIKSNIPVIILSADIQETTKTECYNLGADAFLKKPPAKKVLLDTVMNLLG